MKFLADENFPRPAVQLLRNSGHEVRWISEGNSGAIDEDVLETSNRDAVTLLTLDKDFGELVF
jgi:predicted nuclease of predicted toxin-antitoxin system